LVYFRHGHLAQVSTRSVFLPVVIDVMLFDFLLQEGTAVSSA
jgi:hypothetical protein